MYGKNGKDRELKIEPKMMVNFLNSKIKNKSCDQLLQMLEHNFKNTECPAVALWSQDDPQAMSILNSTVRKIDDHYSFRQLWKTEESDLSNNCSLAEKRLKS